MTNYSADESSCRVDFFKPSGKWYETEAVVFPGETYRMMTVDAVKEALTQHFGNTPRYSGMIAVCLHPYVENPFPVMVQL